MFFFKWELLMNLIACSMVLVIMKERLLKAGRRIEKKGVIRIGTGIEIGTVIGRGIETRIGREARTGIEKGKGIETETGTGTVIIEIATGIGIVVKEGNGAGIEKMMIIIEAAGNMTGIIQNDAFMLYFSYVC